MNICNQQILEIGIFPAELIKRFHKYSMMFCFDLLCFKEFLNKLYYLNLLKTINPGKHPPDFEHNYQRDIISSTPVFSAYLYNSFLTISKKLNNYTIQSNLNGRPPQSFTSYHHNQRGNTAYDVEDFWDPEYSQEFSNSESASYMTDNSSNYQTDISRCR